MMTRRTPPGPKQLDLAGVADAPIRPLARPARGGKRAGAGRKLAPGARRSVPHRPRAVHMGRYPVHVTLRARRGLPSLRSQMALAVLREVLARQTKRSYSQMFRVVEFSVQDNHVHLIVEAAGALEVRGPDATDALRRGVMGLKISFAKLLNRRLRRRGSVWGERWHGRELPTPREVKHALIYVFRNASRHGMRFAGDGFVDPYSSAGRFASWTRPVQSWSFDDIPWPPVRATTWLLERGWREHHGPIEPNEVKRQGR